MRAAQFILDPKRHAGIEALKGARVFCAQSLSQNLGEYVCQEESGNEMYTAL